jgi:hypothetical protein
MSALWNRDLLDLRALVLLFTSPDGTLWSADINDLVDAVEHRVEAGCVTFALVNGRHPSLVDALSAARFAGCTSAVVAVVDQAGDPAVAALPRAHGEMPFTVVTCGRSVESVVRAFELAALAEPAACA